MLVFKETAGFQEPILSFSPTTNPEMIGEGTEFTSLRY